MAERREFVFRRLHSLLGVIPVGVFLTQHLIINYFATRGPEAFNAAAGFMQKLPFVLLLEIFIIALPLLYHAVYGVYIAFTAKSNIGQYGTLRNWLFLLQRLTGVFLIIFISWHVWETRLAAQFFNVPVNFTMMENILSDPFMLGFYIAGVVSAVFHLANGLWSFLVSWGITVSPRSQRITTYVTLVFFVALSYVGVRALFAFV